MLANSNKHVNANKLKSLQMFLFILMHLHASEKYANKKSTLFTMKMNVGKCICIYVSN